MLKTDIMKKFRGAILLLAAISTTQAVWVSPISAAQVTPRSVTLTSSAPSAVTSHAFSFTVPTNASVGSIEFLYCTTNIGACTTPAGLSTTAATLSAQSGATSFGIVNTTNGDPYITRAAASIGAATLVGYTLSNVTNPSTTNTQFWVRIATYASTNATGSPIDSGTVSFDTATQVVLSGTMPESLVFCVGTSGTDCTNMTGSALDLGVFSPAAPVTATSVMSAGTNAGTGYAITVTGGIMSSGANTIPSMGTQSANSGACSPSCTSTIGTSQFGMNLRANTSPSGGADVSGLGGGTVFGGYGTQNSFRFFTGDKVATVGGPTKNNLYTTSYIVNVSPDQAAGVYTTTMTYICTATF